MAAVQTPVKSRSHDDLQAQPPKDAMARIVQEVVTESRKGIDNQALMHHEALMNSLAMHPTQSFVTSYTPYGQTPYPFASFYDNRAIGQIMSPFTAEQVNAITTRLCAPLIGQREVLYVEPQGVEDQLKARVRERLFERMIRSPYTSWADLSWRTCRDLVVRSRAYQEVRPLRVRRLRRQYFYENAAEMQQLVDAGIPPEELDATVGTIRTSYLDMKTLWDGPIVSPLLWGTVHKERSETVINDSTLYVIVERTMPWQQFLLEGKAMFPRSSQDSPVDVPFTEDAARSATPKPDSGATTGDVESEPSLPQLYEPVKFYEFRGINPLGSPEEETLAWVAGGTTLGSKVWDGSGSCMNVIEWVWDPINGMGSSSSPAMIIRTLQEELSLLMSAGLEAVLWSSAPGGGINLDRVNDPNQVRNLRPKQFFALQGESGQGAAIEPIQLGKDANMVTQFIGDLENRGRLASAGIASIVGGSPPGVGTLGEFAGITQGAIDRIGTQIEINADGALRRMYALGEACWRDGLATDADLNAQLGQNEDTMGATLADLDGELDVIPMASRYHQVRKQTIDAMTAIYTQAQTNPTLAARLKPEMDDDFAYAVQGPASRRWFYSTAELAAKGIDLDALKLQQIQMAMSPGGPGTPSPPKDQPATGSDMVTQQGAAQ